MLQAVVLDELTRSFRAVAAHQAELREQVAKMGVNPPESLFPALHRPLRIRHFKIPQSDTPQPCEKHECH